MRARRGLARTWQSIELFDDLTVRENLTVAAHQPSVLTTLKELIARPVARSRAVDEALDVFALGDVAEATPTELTQGQRKLVAVARALVRARAGPAFGKVAIPRPLMIAWAIKKVFGEIAYLAAFNKLLKATNKILEAQKFLHEAFHNPHLTFQDLHEALNKHLAPRQLFDKHAIK